MTTPLPIGGGVLTTYLSIDEIDPETELPSSVIAGLSRQQNIRIDPQIFKTFYVEQMGERFPTVCRETLLALYYLGGIREKDIPRMKELEDSIMARPTWTTQIDSYRLIKEKWGNKDRPLMDRIGNVVDKSSLYRLLRRRMPRVTGAILGKCKKVLYGK